jgi:hypothetical protein
MLSLKKVEPKEIKPYSLYLLMASPYIFADYAHPHRDGGYWFDCLRARMAIFDDQVEEIYEIIS